MRYSPVKLYSSPSEAARLWTTKESTPRLADCFPERPNKLHMQHIDRYFSESEYELANRHNAIRWFICMGVGIPGIVVLAALLGFYLALFISIGAFPGIYFFVTNLFPGSRKHDTVLYKRYKTGRKIASREFEKSKS